jgi:hypothetical protein
MPVSLHYRWHSRNALPCSSLGETAATEGTAAKAAISCLDRLQAKVLRRIRITSSTASMMQTGDTPSAIAGRRHGNWGASMACEIGSPLAQEIAS